MANLTGKDVIFIIDNASKSPVALTAHVNQASVQAAVSMLEDSALGDTTRTYVPGLAGTTIPINGFWNSTTEAIYGPLLGVRTSITKTTQFGDATTDKYYQGEVFVENVQVSGSVDTLETFSADHRITGAVTRTSVALV